MMMMMTMTTMTTTTNKQTSVHPELFIQEMGAEPEVI
jgi:hypothetical protein